MTSSATSPETSSPDANVFQLETIGPTRGSRERCGVVSADEKGGVSRDRGNKGEKVDFLEPSRKF